ncbi:MAG: DUF5005 domain-containing protein [Bacteroidales bacterium]|nr:DUF5005 domain-containing protein [Bacteroidales bacterium]MBN2699031.1 DUF5005 domain-containing protein [Bacteroidales bacterium]
MKRAITGLLPVLLVLSCTHPEKQDRKPGYFPGPLSANYFTDLFMGECYGYTGGDGTYSVPLPDGRTIWLFGDTFIGGVNEDNTRQKQVPIYIRNSVVVQDGDSLRTLYKTKNGRNASFAIIPGQDVPETERWLWPGDGLIEEGKLKIFFSAFTQQDTGMWGFRWEALWIGTYSLPELNEETLLKLYDRTLSQVHFGHAVWEDGAYTYIYGAGNARPHAARYPEGDVTAPWEYYDGTGWTTDISKAQPMDELRVSEQFSVFKLKDTYILLTQTGGLGPDICSYTAPAPTGLWMNRQLLYTTPLPDTVHNLFTYNALAHPQFIKDNQLLVSYNTNSTILEDHFRDAAIYRPRFFLVPLEKIDHSLIH